MTHICVSVCLQSSHFSAGGTLVCLSAHPLVPAAGISECKYVPVSENARVSVYLFVNESVGLPVSFTVWLTPIHTMVFPCPYPDPHPNPPPTPSSIPPYQFRHETTTTPTPPISRPRTENAAATSATTFNTFHSTQTCLYITGTHRLKRETGTVPSSALQTTEVDSRPKHR